MHNAINKCEKFKPVTEESIDDEEGEVCYLWEADLHRRIQGLQLRLTRDALRHIGGVSELVLPVLWVRGSVHYNRYAINNSKQDSSLRGMPNILLISVYYSHIARDVIINT